MKFQMDECSLPFNFYCPSCSACINGELHYNGTGHSLILHNATEIEDGKPDYFIELSTFFLCEKIKKTEDLMDGKFTGTTPFMRTISTIGLDKYNLISNLSKMLNQKDNVWSKIYSDNNVALHKRCGILNNEAITENKSKANSIIDRVLDFFDVIMTDQLKKHINITLAKLKGFDISSVKEITNILGEDYYKTTVKRTVELMNEFVDNIEKYISIILLKVSNSTSMMNDSNYGITTVDYNEVKHMYQDSYEMILNLLIIPILLNNSLHRHNIEMYHNTNMTYEKYIKEVKSERIKYIDDNEYFSISFDKNNVIRNAVAHYMTDFNRVTQEISFDDNYKDRSRNEKMYLTEYVSLCIDNIYIIIYMFCLLQRIYNY